MIDLALTFLNTQLDNYLRAKLDPTHTILLSSWQILPGMILTTPQPKLILHQVPYNLVMLKKTGSAITRWFSRLNNNK